MAFTEFEQKRYEKIVERFIEARRPRPEIRHKIDLSFRMEKQSVVIFEIQPLWRDPEKKIEQMAAKATYVKTKGIWKVFWQRADLQWHSYDPLPEVETIEEFLQVVDKDSNACFFG